MRLEGMRQHRGWGTMWPLAFSGCLLLAVLVITGCGGDANAVKAAGDTPFVPRRVEATPEVLQPPTPQSRPTPQQQAQQLIREYEQKVELEPNGPDTPATLMAIGNLYRQKLSNYKEASFYYRQVITNFPDAPQLSLAYTQLADCYEKLEDWRAAQLVYREIIDRFPPESPEYQYAQEKQNQ